MRAERERVLRPRQSLSRPLMSPRPRLSSKMSGREGREKRRSSRGGERREGERREGEIDCLPPAAPADISLRILQHPLLRMLLRSFRRRLCNCAYSAVSAKAHVAPSLLLRMLRRLCHCACCAVSAQAHVAPSLLLRMLRRLCYCACCAVYAIANVAPCAILCFLWRPRAHRHCLYRPGWRPMAAGVCVRVCVFMRERARERERAL